MEYLFVAIAVAIVGFAIYFFANQNSKKGNPRSGGSDGGTDEGDKHAHFPKN